ncbi:hypothetical protein RM704_10560 [Streptomyces sp. DSM 3412]|uniref:Lipoprotein n=1 Tax=Streptomyces gottesmaniae TaxID=3075518 RepID=A0ABU2YV86_9ACTN|nr:hypothetical protein [Streptomyces sp. DSM 3412]MDT0567906.1 hypothetical protein [Streptomyces sp. DSM 3412]
MRIRHTAVVVAALACALTACSGSNATDDAKATPSAKASATEKEVTQDQKDNAAKSAGIPPEPTGKERQALLDALAGAAPDVVKYEEKAVDAARNQCSAINGGGNRLDWTASMRFTYKDVVTTEEQGAKINEALKSSGFCKV